MISWLPPQQALIQRFGSTGMIYFEARRQFGKTTTFAGIALKQMMKNKGRLVTFASASINVGKELIYKEAAVIASAMEEMKAQAAAAKMRLSLAEKDGKSYASVDVDGIAELFERSRLEMRLYHTQTVCSRTQIIAPNPATARGFSGDVLMDEIGFIPDFSAVWEAMEPIASRDPSFRLLMASTPPEDEGHLCYKLGEPPQGMHFAPCGEGHWYRSQAGVMCLRVDVFDAEECGVRLYDLETKEPVPALTHRERSLNKDGWDRNYALKRIPGGLVAMPGSAIDAAQVRGAERCVALDLGTVESSERIAPDAFSQAEQRALDAVESAVLSLAGPGAWGAGYDIATTTNRKSNPSSLTLMHALGAERWAKLMCRWKTANPYFAQRLLETALKALSRCGGRLNSLDIDASNEKNYATKLKAELRAYTVRLILSGEVVETGDPTAPQMRQKERLGSKLVGLATDRLLALPATKWVKDDFLLVRKEKGLFVTDLDTAGNHGDSFDSTKLAANALDSAGEAEAFYPQTSDLDPRRGKDPSWLHKAGQFLEGILHG